MRGWRLFVSLWKRREIKCKYWEPRKTLTAQSWLLSHKFVHRFEIEGTKQKIAEMHFLHWRHFWLQFYFPKLIRNWWIDLLQELNSQKGTGSYGLFESKYCSWMTCMCRTKESKEPRDVTSVTLISGSFPVCTIATSCRSSALNCQCQRLCKLMLGTYKHTLLPRDICGRLFSFRF